MTYKSHLLVTSDGLELAGDVTARNDGHEQTDDRLDHNVAGQAGEGLLREPDETPMLNTEARSQVISQMFDLPGPRSRRSGRATTS